MRLPTLRPLLYPQKPSFIKYYLGVSKYKPLWFSRVAFYYVLLRMAKIKKLGIQKRIALVAHDNKKADLTEWAIANKECLRKHQLIATGTTGRKLEEALGVPVQRVLSGPLGGDQQLGALIATGEIDVMIFFWDPMEAQPHDSDVKALLRLGVAWNIPMACDRATADFILTSPLMQGEYEAAIPDYTGYLSRNITTEKEG